MIYFNTKILILITFIFTVFIVNSQTVNTGEMTILPGTEVGTLFDFNNTEDGTLINDGDFYVYNHFNNDGVIDHNEEGLTRFVGNSLQGISGDNVSYLYNVHFDNTAIEPAFELSGAISIAKESNFDMGIVVNDGFGGDFTFEQFADHINTTDDSHVDGYVIKTGDNSFNYPIGDAGFYRYAEISAPDSAGDVFTAKYFFETPDTSYPLANKEGFIELIDNQEYWTITNDSGNSNVLLTLSWDEDTTTPEAIVSAPQEAIHIVRWDEGQQLWIDEGGAVDLGNKTVTTSLLLENYGVFTLARIDESLVGGQSDFEIYNGVSPDGDGYNDFFWIRGISEYPNNNVKIYNRWGILIFDTDGYEENVGGNVFTGKADARAMIDKDKDVPTGTYFYVITFSKDNSSSYTNKYSGYLYVNK